MAKREATEADLASFGGVAGQGGPGVEAAAPVAPPTSGSARPLTRGATVEASQDLGGLLELLLNPGSERQIPTGRGGGLTPLPAGRAGEVSESVGRAGQKAFSAITGEPDTGPAKEGSFERILERGASEAMLGLATAPLGGTFKGFQLLRRGIVEGTAAFGGGGASEMSKQRGGGAITQFLANLVGTFSTAGVLRVVRAFGGGLTSGGRQLVSSKYRAKLADRLAPEIAKDLVHGNREEAITLLNKELNRITDPRRVGDPSSSQLLGELAPRIDSLQASLASRSTHEADLLVVGLRKVREANMQAIDAYARRHLSPAAAEASDAAMQGFREAAEQVKNEVNMFWNHPGVANNIKGAPTGILKSQVAAMIKEAGPELDDLLPKREMDLITSYKTTTDYDSLRRLQRRIGGQIRKLERAGEHPETVRYLSQLDSAVNETFEALATRTGTTRNWALVLAKDASRREHQMFDRFRRGKYGRTLVREKNPLVAAFMLTDNSQAGFKNIWNSGRPAKNLKQLEEVLSHAPDPDGAWAGVQQLVMNEVMGEGWEKISRGDFRGIRKSLQGKEEAWDTVFGEGAVDNTREFLRRAEALTIGNLPAAKMGSLQDARQKGAIESFVVPLVGFVRDMTFGRYALAGGRLHSISMGALPVTWDVADTLLMKAMVDKSYMLDLLEAPTPQGLSAFQKQTQKMLRLGRAGSVEVQEAISQQQEDHTGKP